MEQWKVKNNKGYVRTYMLHQGAKRDYGIQSKLISDNWGDESAPLWVQMHYRKNDAEKWLIIEEFMIESE